MLLSSFFCHSVPAQPSETDVTAVYPDQITQRRRFTSFRLDFAHFVARLRQHRLYCHIKSGRCVTSTVCCKNCNIYAVFHAPCNFLYSHAAVGIFLIQSIVYASPNALFFLNMSLWISPAPVNCVFQITFLCCAFRESGFCVSIAHLCPQLSASRAVQSLARFISSARRRCSVYFLSSSFCRHSS